MAAVGEADADRFPPHAEALTSLGVTLEGVRVASEEMLSDALSSVGIGSIHPSTIYKLADTLEVVSTELMEVI